MKPSREERTRRVEALQASKHATTIINAGCASKSLEDVKHGLSLAVQAPPDVYQRTLTRALRTALQEKATEIALYLITEAKAPLDIDPLLIRLSGSKRVLSAIVEHGWNINRREQTFVLSAKAYAPPFYQRLLDFALLDEETVRYCVDHGARVDNEYDRNDGYDGDVPDGYRFPALLETAAATLSVPRFKMIQDLGAPTGPRMLHKALERITIDADWGRKGDHGLEMILFLVDELGQDVNAVDCMGCPPINYAIGRNGNVAVLRVLLERGADPLWKSTWWRVNAIDLANFFKNEEAIDMLEQWKDGKIPVRRKESIATTGEK